MQNWSSWSILVPMYTCSYTCTFTVIILNKPVIFALPCMVNCAIWRGIQLSGLWMLLQMYCYHRNQYKGSLNAAMLIHAPIHIIMQSQKTCIGYTYTTTEALVFVHYCRGATPSYPAWSRRTNASLVYFRHSSFFWWARLSFLETRLQGEWPRVSLAKNLGSSLQWSDGFCPS